MSIIRVENLAKVYDSGRLSVRVLNGLNLDFEKGTLCGLVGSSGCGKTTFLNILGALDRPTAGKVVMDGTDLFYLREKDLYKVRTRKLRISALPPHSRPESVGERAGSHDSLEARRKTGARQSPVGTGGREGRPVAR